MNCKISLSFGQLLHMYMCACALTIMLGVGIGRYSNIQSVVWFPMWCHIANHFFSHSLFSATPTVVGYSWEAYFVTSCALATAFNRLTFYGCYKDCTSGTVDKDLHHVSGTCPVVMSIVSCSLHSHIVPLSCDGSVSSVLE